MIVYLLLNTVNEKAYVGQHGGYTLTKRWNQHLYNVKENRHLTNAIKRYGPASFQRKILCYASCQQELDLLERFWIATYGSTDPQFGYNKQAGGRQWRGQYTKRLRQSISKAIRKAWARKSAKEKWEFAFAVKLRWLMRTERQRRLITFPMWHTPRGRRTAWNKGLKGFGAGRPSARKGRKFGKQENPCRHKTEEHRQRISQGLRRYHRQRRRQEKGRSGPAAVERGLAGVRPDSI
jgi:group I intron endonuclease